MRVLGVMPLMTLAVAISVSGPSSEAARSPIDAPTTGGARDGAAAPHDGDADSLFDAWESHWRVSDPGVTDTDRDGNPDGAEDPDADGLSNLGEQRVGSNPAERDTDGDGIDDAHDDADGNGVRDGMDQDHRPLPSDLTPSLATARGDTPPGMRDGCRTDPGSARLHPCVYGDTKGDISVVLFGDSHALQWEPALIRAAKVEHWRLIALTKSGCPSVDVRYRSLDRPDDVAPCRAWRTRAIGWINAHPPDVVVISNSRAYTVVNASGVVISREPAWEKGLRRTLARLPAGAAQLVIADTARFHHDPVPCLRRHVRNMARCEVPRDEAITAEHDAVEMAAARSEHATFWTLNPLVCPYDPCPVAMGHVMMWRDDSHLTATFARTLWRAVERIVSGVRARSGSAGSILSASARMWERTGSRPS